MSKAKYKSSDDIKLQCKSAVVQLQALSESYKPSGIDPVIRGMVNKAVNVAKEKLLETDHRQSLGDALVDEIGGYSGNGEGAVIAPINNTDRKVRNQMYYAEYGAGIYSHGTKVWKYTSSEDDKAPQLAYSADRRTIASGGQGRTLLRRKQGYKYLTTRGKWVGVTNYSEPAGYMQAARDWLIGNARSYIVQRISFNLEKPLHRGRTNKKKR